MDFRERFKARYRLLGSEFTESRVAHPTLEQVEVARLLDIGAQGVPVLDVCNHFFGKRHGCFLPGRLVHAFSSKAFFDLFFQLAVLRVELLDLLVELTLLFARVVESVDELSKCHVLLLFEYEL